MQPTYATISWSPPTGMRRPPNASDSTCSTGHQVERARPCPFLLTCDVVINMLPRVATATRTARTTAAARRGAPGRRPAPPRWATACRAEGTPPLPGPSATAAVTTPATGLLRTPPLRMLPVRSRARAPVQQAGLPKGALRRAPRFWRRMQSAVANFWGDAPRRARSVCCAASAALQPKG